MRSNTLLLIAGLAIALVIAVFGNNDNDYAETATPRPVDQFSEYTSVLWKARVYDNRIDFLVDGNVFHTVQFHVGERHVGSVTYRNLNGYFDPVLVTVWTRGHGSDSGQRALIIDPANNTTLAEVASDFEVDVSVSDDNRVVLSYAEKPEDTNNQTPADFAYAWPCPQTQNLSSGPINTRDCGESSNPDM